MKTGTSFLSTSKKTSQQQIERSREAGRELETDDSEENFDRLVKKIAKPQPPKDPGRRQ